MNCTPPNRRRAVGSDQAYVRLFSISAVHSGLYSEVTNK